jgi:hypothetical protein
MPWIYTENSAVSAVPTDPDDSLILWIW